MTLKEAIQKDGQRHLYVKSAITSEVTQYLLSYNRMVKIHISYCCIYASNKVRLN